MIVLRRPSAELSLRIFPLVQVHIFRILSTQQTLQNDQCILLLPGIEIQPTMASEEASENANLSSPMMIDQTLVGKESSNQESVLDDACDDTVDTAEPIL